MMETKKQKVRCITQRKKLNPNTFPAVELEMVLHQLIRLCFYLGLTLDAPLFQLQRAAFFTQDPLCRFVQLFRVGEEGRPEGIVAHPQGGDGPFRITLANATRELQAAGQIEGRWVL